MNKKNIILVTVISIIAVIIFVFIFKANLIAEIIIKQYLVFNGNNSSELNVEKISINNLTAKNLFINNPANYYVENINIKYNPMDLLSGKVDSIAFDGLSIKNSNDASIGFLDFTDFIEWLIANKPVIHSDKFVYNNLVFNIKDKNTQTYNININLVLNIENIPDLFSADNKLIGSIKSSNSNININNANISNEDLISLDSNLYIDIPFEIYNNILTIRNGIIKSNKSGMIRFYSNNTKKISNYENIYKIFEDFKYNNFIAKINLEKDGICHVNIEFKTIDDIKVKLNLNIGVNNIFEDISNYKNYLIEHNLEIIEKQ